MKLYVVVVAALVAGLVAFYSDFARSIPPQSPALVADRMGALFLQYRSAVATFQQKNASFTGSVSAQSLASLGFQFPQDFLTVAGNAITATGANGRVVTSYASLPAGANWTAVQSSQGDASIGYASGSNWVSYTSGVSAPLATAVPNGAIVSVIQNGK